VNAKTGSGRVKNAIKTQIKCHSHRSITYATSKMGANFTIYSVQQHSQNKVTSWN